MFTLRNLALALLACRLTAALPTAEADVAPFSFESWAIALANGEETLSVEDAILAANATIESGALDERSLEKRLRCNHQSIPPAYVPDAVACINQLATNGRMCRVETVVAMCTIGRAQIVGVKGGTTAPYTESTCEHVARAAGSVMDNCWRADNTVQGDDYAYGNGHMAVHVTSPSI